VDKILLLIVATIVLILLSINPIYATNHDTSIFLNSLNNTDSNSFKYVNHNFSIQPPPTWVVLNNLPANVSNNAIVVFSNNDHNQLATFGIYHRSISQNLMNLLRIHPENDILATMAQEMSTNGPDFQTVVLSGVVDKYTDGIRVAVNSGTQYKSDNTTSVSENIIYFLNSGDQYTLSLTSNPNNFDKNSRLFEHSANSFLVTQTTAVPEFPFNLLALIVSMFAVICVTRLGIITG
jgi:hypothetical protein